MSSSGSIWPGVRSSTDALARLVSLGWNHLAIYLPVLLMGLLAMVSYWVVSQSPPAVEPYVPRPASEAPDYFMRDFSVRTHGADGRLKSEVRGVEMRHFPTTRTIEVDEVRMRSIDPSGRVTTASALRLLTNDEQSRYDLSGDVLIIRQAHTLPDGRHLPRLEFQGQSMTYLVTEGRLESDQPVQMQRGIDRIQADRLRFNENSGQTELHGRVRALLHPNQ